MAAKFDHSLIAARYLAGDPVRNIAADLGCHMTLINYVARVRDLPRRNYLEGAATHREWMEQYRGRK